MWVQMIDRLGYFSCEKVHAIEGKGYVRGSKNENEIKVKSRTKRREWEIGNVFSLKLK